MAERGESYFNDRVKSYLRRDSSDWTNPSDEAKAHGLKPLEDLYPPETLDEIKKCLDLDAWILDDPEGAQVWHFLGAVAYEFCTRIVLEGRQYPESVKQVWRSQVIKASGRLLKLLEARQGKHTHGYTVRLEDGTQEPVYLSMRDAYRTMRDAENAVKELGKYLSQYPILKKTESKISRKLRDIEGHYGVTAEQYLVEAMAAIFIHFRGTDAATRKAPHSKSKGAPNKKGTKSAGSSAVTEKGTQGDFPHFIRLACRPVMKAYMPEYKPKDPYPTFETQITDTIRVLKGLPLIVKGKKASR